MLRIGVMKIFTDGSMGASSALLFEPYNDDPATCGLAIYSEDELTSLITEADAAGLQCAVHAIGDKANHLVLNGFDKAFEKNPPRIRRHRIEHAQILNPPDLERFEQLGIIASLQPSHLIDDMPWAAKRIGSDRVKNTFLWHSFLKKNIKVAFGTDWPVAPFNPMITLYAAVTRRSLEGMPADGWFPEEKLSMEQAIECYTHGAAYAEFAEHKKGSLEVGKYADFVVLSENLLEILPQKILETEVIHTFQNGNLVYSKE